MTYFFHYPSPIGRLTLASDGEAITGLWIQGQAHFGVTLPSDAAEDGALPPLQAASIWLDRYFAGEQPPLSTLTLRPGGTPFRCAVWQSLCEIPYGQTTSYGALTEKLRQRLQKDALSPRAVGSAIGHNPISILIPCHRVLGKDGSLRGYAGGLSRKAFLLDLEGADYVQS